MKTHFTISKTWYATALVLAVILSSCDKDLSFEAIVPSFESQILASGTFAYCSTLVEYPGRITVEMEWSLSQDMTESHSQIMENGNESYTTLLSGLSKNTTYYYRVTMSNSFLNRSSSVEQFTTLEKDTPIVTVSEINSIESYSAVGSGKVVSGCGADVTEWGLCWNTTPNPTINNYHLSNGLGMGDFTLTMTGLEPGMKYYVRAYAVNRNGIGYSNEVSFTTILEGVIDNVYSVSSNKKVRFSHGNLQYNAHYRAWRFAENQYDYIGEDNAHISSNYNGWIDLFGWGTSGWNCGSTYYRPWDSNTNEGYGPSGNNNLTGSYANADWGVYNAIINGGNRPNVWRTLTNDEWAYLFDKRSTTSGVRYAKAIVLGVRGVILVPDIWDSSIYILNETNNSAAPFSSNVLKSQWIVYEYAGAVFLPAAGSRQGSSVEEEGIKGSYWSASCSSNDDASMVWFEDSSLNPCYGFYYQRWIGRSVRLVKDVN